MNAKNTATGTVHTAKTTGTGDVAFLVQACGKANKYVALTETTAEVTCLRCLKAAPRTAAPAPAATVTPAMRKVLAAVEGRGWVSWRELPAGIATVAKMVALGLLESGEADTQYRAI
jgi:hypothetical protein